MMEIICSCVKPEPYIKKMGGITTSTEWEGKGRGMIHI